MDAPTCRLCGKKHYGACRAFSEPQRKALKAPSEKLRGGAAGGSMAASVPSQPAVPSQNDQGVPSHPDHVPSQEIVALQEEVKRLRRELASRSGDCQVCRERKEKHRVKMATLRAERKRA